MPRNVMIFAMLLTISGAVRGQTLNASPSDTVPASLPADCIKTANTQRTKAWNATPAAQKTPQTLELLAAGAKQSAVTCAAKFSVDDVAPAQLSSLSELYVFIGDTSRARVANDRALKSTALPMRDRAHALGQAISSEIRASSGYFGIIERAERYATIIDAMPDSMAEFKIAAHQTLLSEYTYLDVADGIRRHAQSVIDIAARTGSKANLAYAYESLARAAADMLQPERAGKILDEAEKTLGSAPGLKQLRDRYALIGTKATAITGQWWINTDAPVALQPGDGKVTIVEFTAHWCAPCRNSYPGMVELSKRFANKPFSAVLVTSTYGYVGKETGLTPEQEVVKDREYFATEHALPYPIAINRSSRGTTSSLDDAYRVTGIPQIMIVDKKGIIRQVVIGWDHGNVERFSKYIAELIDER